MTNKIVILGGRGLIGSQLASELAKDYQVTIVDKKVNNETGNIQTITADVLVHNQLAKIVNQVNPSVIINAINLATIFSHDPQKGYQAFIRFYLDLYESLKSLKGKALYLHLGTTGSGGLGFNIPFTHGEDIESLPILNKAAFAGISSSMLTLISRSFNDHIRIAEIKPGLAVFKSKIDEHVSNGSKLITLDGGESGIYTYNELALLTNFMGFTTVDRLTKKIIRVIDNKKNLSRNCRYDIIENFNNAIIAPTLEDYRTKKRILKKMLQLSGKDYIIATGNLGPHTITRDLILAFVIIHNTKLSKQELNSYLCGQKTIQSTLHYIEKNNRNLFEYVTKECNYTNYSELVKNYKHYSRPWEVVASKLGPN